MARRPLKRSLIATALIAASVGASAPTTHATWASGQAPPCYIGTAPGSYFLSCNGTKRTVAKAHAYSSISFPTGTAYNVWLTSAGTAMSFEWNGTGPYYSAVCDFPVHGGLCTYLTH